MGRAWNVTPTLTFSNQLERWSLVVVWQVQNSRIQQVYGETKTALFRFTFQIPDFQSKPSGPSKEQKMKKQLVLVSAPNEGGLNGNLKSSSVLTWQASPLPRNLNFFCWTQLGVSWAEMSPSQAKHLPALIGLQCALALGHREFSHPGSWMVTAESRCGNSQGREVVSTVPTVSAKSRTLASFGCSQACPSSLWRTWSSILFIFSLCEHIFLFGLKDLIFLMIPEFQSLGLTCLLSSSLLCPIAYLILLISMFQT